MQRFLPQLFAAAVLGTLAQPALAQLYRWVDERGTVNYGDTPPANARQVTPLNPDRSGVSVVPGLSREDMDRARQRSEQARIDRLEREVKSLREENSTRPPPPAPSTERETVFVPFYDGPVRPRPHPPKPPRPQPIEPPPPPPPPLFTRPK